MSRINQAAEIGDVGPVEDVPARIGLCSEHGWWYSVDSAASVACPELGCTATVFIYIYETEHKPEDGSPDA